MNYGLYLSASGVLTNIYRQDVYANNLANVETAAFKPDVATVHQRDPEAVEDNLGLDVRHRLLEQLGGGVLAGPQRVSFAPAAQRTTGNPLDVALEAPDTFLAVGLTNPETGQSELRLTRDGRLSRNADGYLVAATTGHKMLDPSDQPILLSDEAEVKIDAAGRVLQNGETVGQLQITGVTDLDELVKEGRNLFRFKDDTDLRTDPSLPTLRPGAIEESGVDPIRALMKMIEATKAVTGNANMIRYHDLTMDRAVNVLGRVASA